MFLSKEEMTLIVAKTGGLWAGYAGKENVNVLPASAGNGLELQFFDKYASDCRITFEFLKVKGVLFGNNWLVNAYLGVKEDLANTHKFKTLSGAVASTRVILKNMMD